MPLHVSSPSSSKSSLLLMPRSPNASPRMNPAALNQQI